MTKTTISFLLLFASLNVGLAQNEQENEQKTNVKPPAYVKVGAGLGFSNFRDFRTSPLIYSGTTPYINLSFLKTDQRRESELGMSYSKGEYSNDFNDQVQISEVNTLSLYYSLMYQLPKLTNDKWNTKVGGQLNITGNYRDNEGLLNYSLGLEIIPTVFASAKIERDVSRTKAKYRKFLFNKKQLMPKTRKLSYQLNVGLVNSQSRLVLPELFDSYLANEDLDITGSLEFQAFSGFRMSSSLNYMIYLKNKNAIQFSYLWDAYRTGNDKQQFEMGSHTLKFSILFKTNNK